ncbi:HIT family protein [Basilea psittacipulmonis]|uniref:HIT family protein n=1 Tax=Basilea psittacipulmonis TaxID=1472345 RepID=UPI0006921CCE|nr:HIT family protein [Basilea psittacipulmonis]
MNPSCLLCQPDKSQDIIWENHKLRVVFGQDPHFPNYTKVIWKEHAKEMSDLSAIDQIYLFKVMVVIEEVQKHLLKADKVNLAQFGNKVPHLHWHIIPRYSNDPKFPEAYFHPHLLRPVDERYLLEQENLHLLYRDALTELMEDLSKHYGALLESGLITIGTDEDDLDDEEHDDEEDVEFLTKLPNNRKYS